MRRSVLVLVATIVSASCFAQDKESSQMHVWTNDPDWQLIETLNHLWASCASVGRNPKNGRLILDSVNPRDNKNKVRVCISNAEKDAEKVVEVELKSSYRAKKINKIFGYWKKGMNSMIDVDINGRHAVAQKKYLSATLAFRDELMAGR